MTPKKLLILGSTGSIGQNTLDVVRQRQDEFDVCTLIANNNIQKLAEQAIHFKPRNVAICDAAKYLQLKQLLAHLADIKIYAGWNGIAELLDEHYDVTIAAVTGIACLKLLTRVLPNTKVIGLANKESIVCAGKILMDMAKHYGTQIVPVDSEHSAIYQVLDTENLKTVEKVTLTASGGPFCHYTRAELQHVKIDDAISHPVWSMGAKISVDSATLMNKGLELIEARYLFDLEPKQLAAVIHPQVLIHGFVEYVDGSVLAQISMPDMRTPISLALAYPTRLAIQYKKFTWAELSAMQFFEPDYERFPCLRLARQAMASSQEKCIVLNMANEIAVAGFLGHKIHFLKIAEVVESALDIEFGIKVDNIEDIPVLAHEVTVKVQNML